MIRKVPFILMVPILSNGEFCPDGASYFLYVAIPVPDEYSHDINAARIYACAMNAVITGASGLVGSELLRNLLDDPDVTGVISVARRPIAETNPKLRQIVTKDLSDLSSYRDDLRGDVFFCCLGTTIKKAGSQEAFRKVDFEAIVEFGRVAKNSEAKAFVLVSATGANEKSAFFYNRVKGETEKALTALNLKRLVIFRPALLVGKRDELRPVEAIATAVSKSLSTFLSTSTMKKLKTDVDHLARRMLAEGKSPMTGVKIIEASEI